MTRVAVVGHVEWAEFVSLRDIPKAGMVAGALGSFEAGGGSAAVAAETLVDLGAEVDFYCALGDDVDGRSAASELDVRGIRVHVAWRNGTTRRALVLIDGRGRRAVVTIGDRHFPCGADALDWGRVHGADAVYFTAGDCDALELARRAPVLVTTPRAVTTLQRSRCVADALVFSAQDEHEVAWANELEGCARLLVATNGADGGRWWGFSSGSWEAATLPGEPKDDYGCGDSFAAGFTFGLALGHSVADAVTMGAACGARCMTFPGIPGGGSESATFDAEV